MMASVALRRALAAASLALVASPGLALAQGSALASARASLTRYDATGDGTLSTLRSLAPVATGTSSDAAEARYLRAIAGADLHVAAVLSGDTALDARLAGALGTTPEALGTELRTELRAARTGLYRAPVDEELALLDATDRFVTGQVPATHAAPRLAALFALGASTHASDPTALAALPAAADAHTPSDLDATTTHAIAALRDALASTDRASRAAREGDPLLALVASRLDAARTALAGARLRVSPAASADIAAADAGAPAAAPDALIVVSETAVLVSCGALVHVVDATRIESTPAAPGCPATALSLPVPASLPTVPQAVDAWVSALSGLGLSAGQTIALAPTEHTPLHLVTRVIRSLDHAHLAPSAFALRTETGALSLVPLPLAQSTDTPPLTVHVRLGGYAVGRAHGHDGNLPRIRGASGLAYDHAGLATLASTEAPAGSSLAVDGMGTVPAVEVARAMRTLASSGARVTLALP
ncbi:MAG: hypothetical protein U0234_10865 [Sandaracinus sp.]